MNRLTTASVWMELGAELRRFIRFRVSDEHVAEDLLQESFVRIHRHIGALQDEDRLVAWVYQIVRNVIHDHFRRSTLRPMTTLGEGGTAEPAKDRGTYVHGPSADWLRQLIHGLPDGYRDAVQWSEIDGLTQQQVADRLGLSLSAAKSRVQRGRAMLKNEILQCCNFVFDRRGNLVDMEPKPDQTACRDCDGDSPRECF